ncbi:hypothetical protein A3B21_01210 [Candidatus Uhrbacteria bacterium RIFCSPLOWO2_01_FULL_47_24]|uniref:Uncharacterized protein n=1 Tax=Candidatus Uhrbacteria bacterium RIFCSPLOWO2_01_FULL_47_24 TaxID=1802401 RepID=A0A1F7URU9_9BACT|nr:MAG: hypothetical protein A2753_03490 [Candidatus Uhrbacteria bacterium RIFCSPHIGHO2_01_FULL_47_11]OGL67722.1 MAG: hypothetical protein A3D58_00970 [Candidatus Uhrbacteria bacterium RIFCSPHIGHO2_02_FULL_46_47]OGL75664.1 MAG: hypothetical protein A3F52_04665 [Candidatus Uhrbacteria bacterium RIFCSPHIGHO2_12_FULL_47_11]OGL81013.1 MAG: hypothetical protein A3B21_01210 [Candidatus Uhrbacteria bacterium RIFCSPLOWO2_01_FULL_47_24]OGL84314.1 MAG: hypothetical protein A3J03_00270 [Candidatus Uhrbact
MRTGLLGSAQWGTVAPYASLGYLRFDAKFVVEMDPDLAKAVLAIGVKPDAGNKHIVKDVPAGLLGAAVNLSRKWLLTTSAAFVPLDPAFEEWVLISNAALGRRF